MSTLYREKCVEEALTAVLNEHRFCRDLVVKATGAVVEVLSGPIGPRGAAFVGLGIDRIDERPADAFGADFGIDEQVFKIAVAGLGPGRGMEQDVRQPTGTSSSTDSNERDVKTLAPVMRRRQVASITSSETVAL